MNNLPPILYQGSVKNVRGQVSSNTFIFEYSDRYSIFDWGEMPDLIQSKGASLAVMGYLFFKLLENKYSWINLFSSENLIKLKTVFDEKFIDQLKESNTYKKLSRDGLKHHMIGLVDINGNDLKKIERTNLLKVKKINVLRPPLINNQYQYDQYKESVINALVPLEVIFRLGLPKGNSFSKRIKNDLNTFKEYGQDSVIEEGSFLKKPIIDFSTKLERGDRYIDYKEAKEISGINEAEWKKLSELTNLIAIFLYQVHQEMGLTMWDGKIELAFIEGDNGCRDFMLVDSVGIDELRLIANNKSLSKEFLREVYKESEWYKNLNLSKEESKLTNVDFKEICINKYKSMPTKLSVENLNRVESLYLGYCNTLSSIVLNEKVFDEKYSIKNYCEKYL